MNNSWVEAISAFVGWMFAAMLAVSAAVAMVLVSLIVSVLPWVVGVAAIVWVLRLMGVAI